MAKTSGEIAETGFREGTRPTDATLDAVKEMLRRAWLTLLTIENTSRGPAPPRTAWPAFPRDANTAYAATPLTIRNFTVSPQDRTNYLEVLGWFASYMNPSLEPGVEPIVERAETVKIFKAWCTGSSIWQLQLRMTTNRRQPASKSLFYKRIDGMVHWIAVAFSQDINRMLKTFRVDRVYEVDQKPRPLTQAAPLLESDLADLPNSPTYYRAPDAKLLPFDHPEAAAARAREAGDEKARRRASGKRQHGKKAGKAGSGSQGSGEGGSSPAACQSAA